MRNGKLTSSHDTRIAFASEFFWPICSRVEVSALIFDLSGQKIMRFVLFKPSDRSGQHPANILFQIRGHVHANRQKRPNSAKANSKSNSMASKRERGMANSNNYALCNTYALCNHFRVSWISFVNLKTLGQIITRKAEEKDHS